MGTSDMQYEIVKPIAIIGRTENGVTKEVNVIKWGNGTEKIDIRGWSADHKRPYKGISLTLQEVSALKQALESVQGA